MNSKRSFKFFFKREKKYLCTFAMDDVFRPQLHICDQEPDLLG